MNTLCLIFSASSTSTSTLHYNYLKLNITKEAFLFIINVSVYIGKIYYIYYRKNISDALLSRSEDFNYLIPNIDLLCKDYMRKKNED
ncbi:MAG: hypothetical protein SVZ03_00440 [Spirochaetota bacterium]|nr:hypothetical protein [Spirochaetota bacterium]